ncbi:unnamed protein product [Nezara viridula]|uniref:Uncharacterized protein n=1 Tax=Nezara viridula TaxID=85310 RepID=A0A9P0E1V5_NEZVI|nr:unnamed protein product [Nezara viridula]
MFELRDLLPTERDVEGSADVSRLLDKQPSVDKSNIEDPLNTSSKSICSLSSHSSFNPSPPSSPVVINFGRRSPSHVPLRLKRKRLLLPTEEDVEGLADVFRLLDEQSSLDDMSSSSIYSVSSLSSFTLSPPSSPVVVNCRKRSPSPLPLRPKRMRLLPPRSKPYQNCCPYFVSMIAVEKLVRDLGYY